MSEFLISLLLLVIFAIIISVPFSFFLTRWIIEGHPTAAFKWIRKRDERKYPFGTLRVEEYALLGALGRLQRREFAVGAQLAVFSLPLIDPVELRSFLRLAITNSGNDRGSL